MLLTVTTTAPAATDLSFLVRKHPDRLHTRELGFGSAHVFFPEATPERCTLALAVAVDALGLAQGSLRAEGYVSDRPYVAGSLLSVALTRCFRSALAGDAPERPDRVDEAMPLVATLGAVHLPGGEAVARKALEPLGYEVAVEWAGPGSTVARLTLRGERTVRDLLRHLFILLPVIDGSKHYYVGVDEVDKLVHHGEGWLADHPERDWVINRYLRHRKALARRALARLVPDPDQVERDHVEQGEESRLEKPVRLNDQRHEAVIAALGEPGREFRTVVDLGCGEGRVVARLARSQRFSRVLGVDVSPVVLTMARERLDRLNLSAARRERVSLALGSALYADDRLTGFDAALLVEVIEHVDPSRLGALAASVFGHARPGRVIVTTPNAEYNATWPSLPAGRFRHRDHRFEWTRLEFRSWTEGVAATYGYAVRCEPIGPVDPHLGPPTQMAVFDLLGPPESPEPEDAR